jgi:outer membrane protein W
MESHLKNLLFLVAVFCLILVPASAAHAQQFDLSAGLSAVTAPKSTATLQTVGGGAFPTFGMDFLFFHNAGIEFNAALRAKENLFEGVQPFRPFFYDVDAVYAPPIGHRAQAELSAGIGAESIHFYTPNVTCSFVSCTNVVTSNHFLAQLGAGLRFYATPRVFIEPSVHVYLIHNNVEFSGSHATRAGISIGYSFKNQE